MEFENYEQYKAQRDGLLKEAEEALNNHEMEKCAEKRKEVTELDAAFEKWRTEQANLNALAGKAVKAPANFENMKGNDKMEIEKIKIEDVVSSKGYRDAYLKNLQSKELNADERAMLENAAVSGAALIPTITMDRIIGVLHDNPILARIDMTFIPSNVSYPKENSIADASWIAMDTPSTDSEDSYTYISLAAYKLIKTVEIGADVQAMSIDAFEDWLVTRLANKIEKACDNAVFNGTGSGQPTGILKAGEVTTSGTYTATGMTYADLMNMLGALPSFYHNNAIIACSRQTFYGEILGVHTDGGEKVVVADVQAPARFNILGYPVVVDDNIPVGTVCFGDFFRYKFNFAKAPTVEPDFSVGFRTGSVCYRAMALADGKLGDANAIVVYKKATGGV